MSGRNMCWQYNTTQNDRVPLYLNYSFLTSKTKNHTLMAVKNIYNITI